MNLGDYRTFIFDCDGVVLNSNKVKTEAFYKAVLPYGEKFAETFVTYHQNNGGVSRYKKFEYFLSNIVPEVLEDHDYETLLKRYADEVFQGMIECEEAKEIRKLRETTSDANWLIASGGDQAELREIFTQRGMIDLFDGGIFGSPDTKEKIFERELTTGNIQTPALFLGDSKYDYSASQSVDGIDFIFLSGWTEVEDWETWVKKNKLVHTVWLSDMGKR